MRAVETNSVQDEASDQQYLELTDRAQKAMNRDCEKKYRLVARSKNNLMSSDTMEGRGRNSVHSKKQQRICG